LTLLRSRRKETGVEPPETADLFIKNTESLCPECLKVIPATVYGEDGKVYITKICPEHGEVTDLYWGDYSDYIRAEAYNDLGVKLTNPRTQVDEGCPYDCGICTEHQSHTVLALIDVTNRCNLRCPICFAHAGAAGYLYEPSKEQILGMMENLLTNDPVPPPAIQFSGGEPTVREDLPELIEAAMEMGFIHSQVSTNGIRMAQDPDYCWALKNVRLSTVYLQFDGVTPEPYMKTRGADLLDIKMQAIRNLRAADFRSIVLVPVLVKGVNDHQVGDIIRFAIENRDCIRSVNFQPVAFTGRIDRRQREQMRITIPELMRLAEEQTDGMIGRDEWYPVSSTVPLCQFLTSAKDEKFVDLSPHQHCGMGAYLFIDGDEVTPLSELMNIEGFLDSLRAANEQLLQGRTYRARMTAVSGLLRNVRFRMLKNFISALIYRSDYHSLDRLHHSMVLISAMHFMDAYNFDLDRVRRCVVHYAVPDGRIIPFCAMNTLHRRSIEREHARPLEPEEITPLFDVEGLREQLKREAESQDH